MVFIQVKSLAGLNYIRASEVIGVTFSDPIRSTVMMAGGVTIACSEPAGDIAARIEAAVAEAAPVASPAETAHKE